MISKCKDIDEGQALTVIEKPVGTDVAIVKVEFTAKARWDRNKGRWVHTPESGTYNVLVSDLTKG